MDVAVSQRRSSVANLGHADVCYFHGEQLLGAGRKVHEQIVFLREATAHAKTRR